MLDKVELVKWLQEEADGHLSTDDRSTGYYHTIAVIESGEFDAKDDWEQRFSIAFENNVRYIEDNSRLRETIETALYELERLERNLEMPERGYVRNLYRGVMSTLKEGIAAPPPSSPTE